MTRPTPAPADAFYRIVVARQYLGADARGIWVMHHGVMYPLSKTTGEVIGAVQKHYRPKVSA